ncbi:MAG: hypothetical protein Q8N83_05570 [Ignavibacteria bacterium]|nr:hypothetical protein [Ignavibacteria bacterium]
MKDEDEIFFPVVLDIINIFLKFVVNLIGVIIPIKKARIIPTLILTYHQIIL